MRKHGRDSNKSDEVIWDEKTDRKLKSKSIRRVLFIFIKTPASKHIVFLSQMPVNNLYLWKFILKTKKI